MKIRIILAALFGLMASACDPSGSQMTLEQLLEKNAEARGGAAAIENVQSIAIEALIEEPAFTLTGDYVATRDGWMRIDVYANDTRVFTEALGPDGGWQMFDDGSVADLSTEGEAALHRGVAGNLFGLHELPNRGYTLTLVGETTRNEKPYWEIEKIAPDGFSEHVFIDPDTFLVAIEIQTSALHPDLDSTETRQETFALNYSETAGVLFAEKSEKRNIDTGEVMQTVTVNNRRINEPVDAAHFARPAPDATNQGG